MISEIQEKDKPELNPPQHLITEVVSCNLCGANQHTRLFTEEYNLQGSQAVLGINRCDQCKLVYVSPRLNQASTSLVYRYDAEHTISHNYCWEGSSSNSRFAPLISRLEKTARPGRLLDVGCGGGHFLQAAAKTGIWQVEGLEPSAEAAEQARQFTNCKIKACFLEEADFPENHFSVISMLGVLEHLHNPTGILRQVHHLLEENGTLAVYVPNYSYLRLKDTGLLSRMRFGKSSHLCPQEHLFQYTQTTLINLLEESGFEVLRSDVGRPFVHGSRWKRTFKESAFLSVNLLKHLTGIHLGGLEVIARKSE